MSLTLHLIKIASFNNNSVFYTTRYRAKDISIIMIRGKVTNGKIYVQHFV
jgi:hypothetical protein